MEILQHSPDICFEELQNHQQWPENNKHCRSNYICLIWGGGSASFTTMLYETTACEATHLNQLSAVSLTRLSAILSLRSRMTEVVNNELERIWKEVVMTQFEVREYLAFSWRIWDCRISQKMVHHYTLTILTFKWIKPYVWKVTTKTQFSQLAVPSVNKMPQDNHTGSCCKAGTHTNLHRQIQQQGHSSCDKVGSVLRWPVYQAFLQFLQSQGYSTLQKHV